MLAGMRRILIAGLVVVLVAGLGTGTYLLGMTFGWWVNPTVVEAADGEVAEVDPLVTDLAAPWDVDFLPDGTALVTERDTARLLSVTADGAVSEVQHIDEANSQQRGEGGLLGVAVSPDYEEDGWIYLYYTTEQDNRVARLQLGEPPEPVLTGIPNDRIHNGGRIAFGPSGYLYVATGDAADRDQPQDRDSLAGKILRITPDGAPAPGNPFGTEVYSWGHRNVQGIAWDDAGQLYATEFGQDRYDELNRIVPGGNYGWPEVEGVGGEPDFVDPIATWHPSDASCSGLAFHAGSLWIACLRGQRLYQIDTDGSSPVQLLTGEYGRLRHVAPAPDGSLWVLTSNRDGRGSPGRDDDQILRVVP